MRLLRLFGLRLYRVRGHSMAPTMAHGTYLLLRLYGKRRRPRRGDICVFRTAQGQTVIKRLASPMGGGCFRVRGDSSLSAPGIDFGPVAERALIGRVILTSRPLKSRAEA